MKEDRSEMKIVLSEYKEGVPREVEEKYNGAELDVEFVDMHYTRPVEMHGTVEKGPDTVTFKGHLTSEVETTCGRCLVGMKRPFDAEFDIYLETKDLEVIDAMEDIREVLLLEHDLAYTCREDCKGLCPQCGVNRNEKACKCQSSTGKTENKAFSALKNLLKKNKEK